MALVDPRLMESFVEWADRSYPAFQQYGSVIQALDNDHWQDWGSAVISIPGISQLGAPSPYQFSDWKDWATRLNQVLNQGY